MTRWKLIVLVSGLSVSSLFVGPYSHAKKPPVSFQESLQGLETAELLEMFNYKNVMELMEAVVVKDKNYDGPAHLHPLNRTMLKKTFLPHYFDSLDSLHHAKRPSLTKQFVVGKGDQSHRVEPLDLTNIYLSGSKNGADEAINEEIWGSLTSRQLFAALDFPKIEQVGINISFSKGEANRTAVNTSLSEKHLSLQASNEMGVWIYSLDMSLGSNAHTMKLTTKNSTEIYTLQGMSTDAIQSILVNNKVVFEKSVTTKVSDRLREELDL